MGHLDLDFADLLPRRGRPGVPPLVVGELGEEDLLGLGGQTAGAGPVQRIRESHHQIARLLASGLKHVEVAAVTGRSPEGIGLLAKDPSVLGLIEFYRQQRDGKFLDMQERLATAGATALGILQEKLETEGLDLSPGELNEIIKTVLDRAGYGPQSKHSLDIKHGISDELLQQIRSAAENRGRVRTLEGELSPSLLLEHSDAAPPTEDL